MTAIFTRYETADASKYLMQLCKHFAHKVPASWDETSAHVSFGPGSCAMTASETELSFVCRADTPDDLQRLIHVVEAHLIRFAWRDSVELDWADERGEPVIKTEALSAMLAAEREKFASKRLH